MIAVESTEKLKATLGANGFPYAGSMMSVHKFWYHGKPEGPPIHAMFVDARTFEKMWAASIPSKVSGIPLRVPCMAHLAALKLFAVKSNPKRRSKDLRDVFVPLETNPGVVSREQLADICKRYASQDVAEELQRLNLM